MNAQPPHPETPQRGSPRSLDRKTLQVLAGQLYQPPRKERQPAVLIPSIESKPPRTRIRPRKKRTPIFLFAATCASTFFVGATAWNPLPYLADTTAAKEQILAHWPNGLLYMSAVLGILLTHEMGHFLVALRYKIPSSYPLFIPVPVHPVGTLGAVIGMDGLKANRREIFDMGLSGPVAGLLVAIPVLWVGIAQLDLSAPPGEVQFHNPLIGKLMMQQLHPEWAERTIGFEQLNPLFMAGWVGMLITGLNMLPISQLDGGHVIHALFTPRAKWVSRGFLVCVIYFIITQEAYNWVVMLVLVILIGTDHPPSSDDKMPLGPVRTLIGFASLAIPVFCFAPMGIEM